MCQLFAHQPQRDYKSQTRSLRIDGHCTSIRLEMAFWDTLEEIAAKEDMSLAKFLSRLHSEVLDHHGEVHNFASLLRCSCLIYRSKSTAVMPDFLADSTPRLVAAESSVIGADRFCHRAMSRSALISTRSPSPLAAAADRRRVLIVVISPTTSSRPPGCDRAVRYHRLTRLEDRSECRRDVRRPRPVRTTSG